MVLSEIPSMVGVWIFSGTRTFLVANLATNFQDLVAKVENLVALAPVLGAISRPVCIFFAGFLENEEKTSGKNYREMFSYQFLAYMPKIMQI